MEFTIKRSEWQRGAEAVVPNPDYDPEWEGYQEERIELDTEMLRAADQKKCCLGFAALACGYTEGEAVGTASPAGVATRTQEIKGFFNKLIAESERTGTRDKLFRDNELTNKLIKINDDEKMPEAERESKITALFAEIGVSVRFED